MEIRRIPRASAEDVGRIERAGQDIRYVPQGDRLGFSGAAHETRYLWVVEHCELRGKSVLDFGCGAGYGANLMAEEAGVVHGIDSSEEAILFARRFYAKANLRFYALNACCSHDLLQELAVGGYDVVVSFDVIEHIEKYFDYLENVVRLMKGDGQFVLSTPNRLQTFQWNARWNPCHLQEFSPYQLRKLLGLYFESVLLVAQDFAESARRETVRNEMARRTAVAESPPLARMIRKACHSVAKRVKPGAYQHTQALRYSDIRFSSEPGEEALGQAFGLLAVCERPRTARPDRGERQP